VLSLALRGALTDQSEPSLRQLPHDVVQLLEQLQVPPRLAAHLRLVHDVAAQLTATLQRNQPDLGFDRVAVLFGAATHDVGKVVHPDELTGPGSAHEPAGRALLLAREIPERLARFAGTHGTWSEPDRTVEDLLVSVADNVWKGKRVADLEDRLRDHLAAATGLPPWEAYLALDDVLSGLAATADRRLAFQNFYPVRT
jgi:hypothetical protein